ncbi:uncharacterized protein PG986_000481 [Apiospora aurea]|uniref:Uncharacterized protein n=1 Tax=Apiospora aurea TaxID=335848 RepID=A0ABR1QU78_9PEZI
MYPGSNNLPPVGHQLYPFEPVAKILSPEETYGVGGGRLAINDPLPAAVVEVFGAQPQAHAAVDADDSLLIRGGEKRGVVAVVAKARFVLFLGREVDQAGPEAAQERGQLRRTPLPVAVDGVVRADVEALVQPAAVYEPQGGVVRTEVLVRE